MTESDDDTKTINKLKNSSLFWQKVGSKMWHHDFDNGGTGFSITIEDLENILKEMSTDFPISDTSFGAINNGDFVMGMITVALKKASLEKDWLIKWLGIPVEK